MHQVIKNLLVRKNKKVPVNDGHKIVLVLFGGLMTGIRSAGAMLPLEELGLANSFDEIYAISAGLTNALYLLSGNGKEGTSIYYEDLPALNFINFKRFWKIADISVVLKSMQQLKPLNVNNILSSQTKLYTRLFNHQLKQIEYLDVQKVGKDYFWPLVQASISAPYFQPGTVNINGQPYKDPSFSENDVWEHIVHAMDQKATDYLIIYNRYEQYEYVSKRRKSNVMDNVLEIFPRKGSKLSHFEMNCEKLKNACLEEANDFKQILGSNEPVSLSFTPTVNKNILHAARN
jgi:predicted patatin/cPLA2 family phospholipase